MKSLFANSLDIMLDWEESKIKRTAKGKGGGQFASKGGAAKGGSGSTKSETGGSPPASSGQSTAVAAPKIAPGIVKHRAEYARLFPKSWGRFKESVGHLGKISGRVKKSKSVADKLTGRYAGLDLSSIGDMIGMRCDTQTVNDVYKGASLIRANFKVLETDDKMPEGQGFYRALHLIVDSLDKTGNKRAEIQLRTVRQSNVAMWGHDIAYKGKFGKHPDVQLYAKQVSDANWELDNGRQAVMPAAPDILKKNGLDFDPEREYDDHWVAREKPEFL